MLLYIYLLFWYVCKNIDCLLIIDFALNHGIIHTKERCVILMTHFVHPHYIELLQLVLANVNLILWGIFLDSLTVMIKFAL